MFETTNSLYIFLYAFLIHQLSSLLESNILSTFTVLVIFIGKSFGSGTLQQGSKKLHRNFGCCNTVASLL